MHSIVIVTFFFAVHLSFGANTQERTYLPSGCSTYVTCKESKNQKGQLHGDQTCYHASKKELVLIKAHWQNDKLEKDFFCANDDGIPVVQASYKNGELDGEYKTYSSSEKKWITSTKYKNGKRDGVSISELSNGRKRITLYKSDKAHGYTLILDKNEKITSLDNCTIDNSRKSAGECEKILIPGYEKQMMAHFRSAKDQQKVEANRKVDTKFPNGKTRERYEMVDGKRIGQYELFYESGTPKLISEYKDGLLQEEKVFFESGQIESHNFYRDVWKYKVLNYFQNGKKKFEKVESISKDDKILTDIDYTHYYDNGQIAETGRKLRGLDSWGDDGIYNSEIKNFTKTGHLFAICKYVKGKPVGICKRSPEDQDYEFEDEYDEKGTLLSTRILERSTKKQVKKVDYFPDGSTKSEQIDPDYEKKMKTK